MDRGATSPILQLQVPEEHDVRRSRLRLQADALQQDALTILQDASPPRPTLQLQPHTSPVNTLSAPLQDTPSGLHEPPCGLSLVMEAQIAYGAGE